MWFGVIGKKVFLNYNYLVDEFVKRLDVILLWDIVVVNVMINIKVELVKQGILIGGNDVVIVGYVIFVGVILVINNIGEFERVKKLRIEDWIL